MESSTRLPGFCLNRFATRVRVRPPPLKSKPISPEVETVKETSDGGEKHFRAGAKQGKVAVLGRKIMIVVDSSPEAKSAVQWALSHAVQSNDMIVLLNVVKPSKHGEAWIGFRLNGLIVEGLARDVEEANIFSVSFFFDLPSGYQQPQRRMEPRSHKLLYNMKKMCQAKRPEVRVEVCLVQGKDRGPTIVEEAKQQQVSLLVLGQKRRSITWRLLMMWTGNGARGGGVVDYCVQNAACMTLAVRRKGRRAGGYLITTRRHKDFWLLA